jgi:predicted metalloprotease with PDZ domain
MIGREDFSASRMDATGPGYTFKDVVASLNAVQPYDWQGFLSTRLEGHGPGAPLDGLARSGWKLAYTDTPTDFFKDVEAYRKIADFYYSLGITLDAGGRIAEVVWDSPAFKAGLSQGFSVVAVNGTAYKPELLKLAITAAKREHQPIELLVKQADRYQTVRIDYTEGLKYPRLLRVEGTPDRLEAIFRPLP